MRSASMVTGEGMVEPEKTENCFSHGDVFSRSTMKHAVVGSTHFATGPDSWRQQLIRYVSLD